MSIGVPINTMSYMGPTIVPTNIGINPEIHAENDFLRTKTHDQSHHLHSTNLNLNTALYQRDKFLEQNVN